MFGQDEDFKGIPTGDMPGDSIQINATHVAKAATIYPRLRDLLAPILDADPHHRAVVSVHGGSGVGKSETASVLAELLRRDGLGSYVLSGDTYPRRIRAAHDAERLRRFRSGAVRGLAASGLMGPQLRAELAELQAAGADADPAQVAGHPWLATYLDAGRRALAGYLGTDQEIDFDEINRILAAFHAGEATLTLKRMGRAEGELWYDAVDVSGVSVLVIEWTHGNNDLLAGVDVPILLNSTPEETLAHRRARARDGATDSPFTMLVLALEQEKLHAQSPRARIIVSKSGELLTPTQYREQMGQGVGAGPMLNVYPDSIAGNLAGLVDFVRDDAVAGAFSSLYLLPSVFNTDLDRGFSVIDYELNELYARPADLDALAAAGLDLKFDFILNHASVLSPQFQDLLARGDDSPYRDFFIDWNAFWAGHGELTDGGWVQPDPELIREMFFRKPGLPILMVRFPDGSERPFWNTFYQEVRYPRVDAQELMRALGVQYATADALAGRVNAALDAGTTPSEMTLEGFERHRAALIDHLESRRTYLGQMDLNIKSPLVWDFYADVLGKLAGYGAKIVRLDAFAYAPKEPGEKNFLNDPGTWDLLERVRGLADAHGVRLLPEIHSRYEEKIHEVIAAKGYLTYDFFLPGLLIHAFETRDASTLKRWIGDLTSKGIRCVNMLGCHDGIPLLDLKGLLTDDEIDHVIETVKGRGGYVKDLHGEKKMYYQVNATYYSALGESDAALLLARAIQLFMPGKPQVWYLDLFAGRNNLAAVERAGSGGHKEINRTNLSTADVAEGLGRDVVRRQLDLLRFRAAHPAFGWDAACTLHETPASRLRITWERAGATATLDADLASGTFTIEATDAEGHPVVV